MRFGRLIFGTGNAYLAVAILSRVIVKYVLQNKRMYLAYVA